VRASNARAEPRRVRCGSSIVVRKRCVSMRFLVALREVEAELHCALIPDLPGCRAVGRNARQALLYVRRAIDEHCRRLALDGEPLPETQPLESHMPLPDLFDDATFTSVDVAIEHYFVR
jgi:predicted RNase H-like HicB family nuclease